MDVRDPSGQRVLDRDHAQRRLALLHRGEGILEGGAGIGVHLREFLAAGEMGIGAGHALEGDSRLRRAGGQAAGAGRDVGGAGCLAHEGAADAGRRFWHALAPPPDPVGPGAHRRPRRDPCDTWGCQEKRARHAGQILRSIDAGRDSVNAGDADGHAVLQRAQLLQPLPPFQRRGRQAHEAFQGRAAIGVDADMVPDRPLPRRCGGAGEIERAAQAPPWRQRRNRLDHVGVLPLARIQRGDRQGADIGRQHVQRFQHRGDHRGRDRRQVALQVDDRPEPAFGVAGLQRGMHPVGPAGQGGIRQHRLAASRRSPRPRWRHRRRPPPPGRAPLPSRGARPARSSAHRPASPAALSGSRVAASRAGITIRTGWDICVSPLASIGHMTGAGAKATPFQLAIRAFRGRAGPCSRAWRRVRRGPAPARPRPSSGALSGRRNVQHARFADSGNSM